MEFNQEVLQLLAEICQDDIVMEETTIDLFDSSLLDSFATVELLVEIEARFGITVPITDFDRETWATPAQIIERLVERR